MALVAPALEDAESARKMTAGGYSRMCRQLSIPLALVLFTCLHAFAMPHTFADEGPTDKVTIYEPEKQPQISWEKILVPDVDKQMYPEGLRLHQLLRAGYSPEVLLAVYDDLAILREKQYSPEQRLCLYRKIDENSYRLMLDFSCSGAGTWIERPTFFSMGVAGERRKQLLFFRSSCDGTGRFGDEYAYILNANGVLPVTVLKSSLEYKDFAKDEGNWKGESVWVSANRHEEDDDRLLFRFGIWKDGDGNCCPSRGYVTGKYTLAKDEKGYRLIPGDFLRHLPDERK